MTMTCVECKEQYHMTPEHLAMLERLSPVIDGTRIPLPPPRRCPSCRQQRRIAFRNDSFYYKNVCSSCKKHVISIYSPDKVHPILCHECFWSDQWSAESYGRPYDLRKSYAEQFAALKNVVPRLCIFNTQSENSDYTVHSSRNKNCYMCSSLIDDENVYYSDFIFHCKDCIDCFSCERMELCSSSAFCEDCYNSDWLTLCFNVTDAMFCVDCKGGGKLLGCVGRRNASLQILNEHVSEETYATTRKRLLTDDGFRAAFRAKVEALRTTIPVPHMWQIGSEGSTGNYIFHCKNVQNGYNVKYFEDCYFVNEGHRNVDCFDLMRSGNGELLYNCVNVIDLTIGAFCNLTYQCNSMLYSDNCHSCNDCFACFGMKKARYCILNKQYTKEEYERLVPEIIESMKKTEEWGEFPTPAIASFGYNESKANEWYPLSQQDVLQRGWLWSEYEQSLPEGLKGIDGALLPGNIDDVPDDILNYTIRSQKSGKPYRLIAQELAFYRRKGLPIPRLHPHERLRDVSHVDNRHILHERQCPRCQRSMQTTYGPDSPYTVLCEPCYLQEVY